MGTNWIGLCQWKRISALYTDTKSAISTIQSLIVCVLYIYVCREDCVCLLFLFYFQFLFYIRCRCVIIIIFIKIVFINLFLFVIFVRLPFVIRVLIRFWMTEFILFLHFFFPFVNLFILFLQRKVRFTFHSRTPVLFYF